MTPQERKAIFNQYLEDSSPEASDVFMHALRDASDAELTEFLEASYEKTPADSAFFSQEEKRVMFRRIMAHEKRTKQKKIVRTALLAASLCLLTAFGIWFYKSQHQKPLTNTEIAAALQDIEPGSNKATLTLSDGASMELSASKEGIILDNKAVRYHDGTVISDIGEEAAVKGQTIRIHTPNGGQYQVTLPDGSKVWLNAASSLTYSTDFGPKQRKVVLTGEAYFDVESDPSRPFYVVSRGQIVEVTGTQFNISCYSNEPFIKTTLLEGSLRVVSEQAQSEVRLKPGEQALLNPDRDFRINREHIQDAIAWKQGYFRFKQADINQVMRELSRWYDIPLRFEGHSEKAPLQFWGELYRSAGIEEALEIMTYFNLKYRIDYRNGQKEIVIYP